MKKTVMILLMMVSFAGNLLAQKKDACTKPFAAMGEYQEFLVEDGFSESEAQDAAVGSLVAFHTGGDMNYKGVDYSFVGAKSIHNSDFESEGNRLTLFHHHLRMMESALRISGQRPVDYVLSEGEARMILKDSISISVEVVTQPFQIMNSMWDMCNDRATETLDTLAVGETFVNFLLGDIVLFRVKLKCSNPFPGPLQMKEVLEKEVVVHLTWEDDERQRKENVGDTTIVKKEASSGGATASVGDINITNEISGLGGQLSQAGYYPGPGFYASASVGMSAGYQPMYSGGGMVGFGGNSCYGPSLSLNFFCYLFNSNNNTWQQSNGQGGYTSCGNPFYGGDTYNYYYNIYEDNSTTIVDSYNVDDHSYVDNSNVINWMGGTLPNDSTPGGGGDNPNPLPNDSTPGGGSEKRDFSSRDLAVKTIPKTKETTASRDLAVSRQEPRKVDVQPSKSVGKVSLPAMVTGTRDLNVKQINRNPGKVTMATAIRESVQPAKSHQPERVTMAEASTTKSISEPTKSPSGGRVTMATATRNAGTASSLPPKSGDRVSMSTATRGQSVTEPSRNQPERVSMAMASKPQSVVSPTKSHQPERLTMANTSRPQVQAPSPNRGGQVGNSPGKTLQAPSVSPTRAIQGQPRVQPSPTKSHPAQPRQQVLPTKQASTQVQPRQQGGLMKGR